MTSATTSGVGGRQRRVREAGALTGYGAPAVSTPGLGSRASRVRPGGGWAQRLRCTGCQHCGSLPTTRAFGARWCRAFAGPRRESKVGWCVPAVGIRCEDEFFEVFFGWFIDLKFLNFET